MPLMGSIWKPILLQTDHQTSANTEQEFPWLGQMKECYHFKSHKKNHPPPGFLGDDGPVQAQLLFMLCVCVCVLTYSCQKDLVTLGNLLQIGLKADLSVLNELLFRSTGATPYCWIGQKALQAWQIMTCEITAFYQSSQLSVNTSSSSL